MAHKNDESMEHIDKVKEGVEDDLLSKQNVVGVGVGQKVQGGVNKGETSIVVLVKEKKPLGALAEEDIIPPEIDGVKTDVIEVGELRPMMACVHCKRERPVFGGLSAIWQKGTACTLGAIVFRDGKKYALMNTHCGIPHWEGAKVGDPVIQPSGNDGGKKIGNKDVIGHASEFYQELVLDNKTVNAFDSCLVELNEDVEVKPLYLEGVGEIQPKTATVKSGEVVTKSGRTTGVQSSTVIATDVTVRINYDDNAVGVFEHQVIVQNAGEFFTAGGDSSSLVVNSKKQPVGQVYAGSDRIGIFCPIQPIMDKLGFTFDEPSSEEPVGIGYVALTRHQNVRPYVEIFPSSSLKGNKGDLDYNMSVRTGPSTDAERIGVLPAGTRFEIVEEPKDDGEYVWAKIRII